MTESASLSWPAPAKINLFLHVTGRRPDGYHELQTLFQLIDLCDELSIEVTDSGLIERFGQNYGVPADQDLVVRAALLLQSRTGCRKGARIGVEKQIPLGAGLGGGSSDAATTLLALNQLWGCGLGLEELAQLGLGLGADVPVFVLGRSALAAGVGERLQSVELGLRHYVLVFNEQEISTAAIFRHPDLKRKSRPIDMSEALAGEGRNDCEPVVRAIYPAIDRQMKVLEQWGRPRMTGTGSCVFLSMPDEKAAISAASEIKCRYNVRVVCGLDLSPAHVRLDPDRHNN